MIFEDVYVRRRLRRLEIMVLIVVEQLSTGSMTTEHQGILGRFAEEILAEIDAEPQPDGKAE